MGKTTIEWTDCSWNPIVGCTEVSPGCAYCDAARLTHGRLSYLADYKGLTERDTPEKIKREHSSTQYRAGKTRWKGQTRFLEHRLREPQRWIKPRRIFVCDMGDLFHESVPHGWLVKVFEAMASAPQHTYQLLTKRAARMREWLDNFALVEKHHPLRDDCRWPWPNVWCGVSVENQHFADERIPLLLATPTAVRFISAEPLLGPVDVTAIRRHHAEGFCRPLDGRFRKLDWVICGGESGPNARPMHPEWARSLRDQCVAAGVPFFFKQWGEYKPVSSYADHVEADLHAVKVLTDGDGPAWMMMKCGKKKAGRLLDGREWSEFPK